MQHIQYTYVDALTGISVAKQPAVNGPVMPAVKGLAFVWARESAYPTDVPHFFGTCPAGSNTQTEGVLGVFDKADWDTMRADELARRAPDPKLAGVLFEGVRCSATREDQNGLMAVLLAHQMQGAAFKPTTFFFANGAQLVLTKDNVPAFAGVWMPFRQSFFLASGA